MNKKKRIFGNGLEILLGISVLFAFILPHTSTLLLLVNPILCILLFLFKKDKRVATFCWMPMIAILLALLLNISGEASSKSVFAAIAIIIYLFTFPMVRAMELKNTYLYLTFGLIFLSQIGYIYQWTPIVNLVNRFYPVNWNEKGITHMMETINETNYISFRLGGLYRNPNQCAKYVTLLFSVFLIKNKDKSMIKQIWFVLLCFVSVLMTGSRTGFVVIGLLLIFAMAQNNKMKSWIRIVIAIVTFSYMVYLVVSGDSSYRGLAIEEGFTNSAGLKYKITMKYIAEEQSVIKMLFGHLDSDLFETNTTYSLDCEYGYVIYCYGFVGLIAFLLFYVRLFKQLEKRKRMFFIVLLWMITSSIFMAYRMAFAFMLLLSTIFSNNQKEGVDS